MEWRSQEKSIGNPSYKNQSNQGSSTKHAISGEDQKRREDSIHEDTIFNPSPDAHQTRIRRDPDPVDPTQIASQPEPITRYRECQKNHSAHLGTHVTDGCGEFMPDGDDGTLESMKCAACGCHRNFHRKETSGAGAGLGVVPAPTPTSNFHISYTRHQTIPGEHSNVMSPFPFRQAPAAHHRRFSDQPPMMAFGDGGDASSEDLNMFRSDGEGYGGVGTSKKRFRTKFTHEQKERMMELAQKIGWRIQKQDENDVQQFCASTGIKRQVFKVWMHNNKQAMKRKQS